MDDLENSNELIFKGVKTAFACRYKTSFEFRLMNRFELAAKVKRFYQPHIMALVRNFGIEQYIKIDFWIEYHNGKVDLLYIEKKSFTVGEKAEVFILKRLQDLPKFGVVVINQETGDFRRIRSERIKCSSDLTILEICFVNFTYIN